MRKRILVCSLVLSGMMLATVAGCGGKPSEESYNKVELGMTLAQVEKLLGKGELQTEAAGAIGGLGGSGKVCTWVDGDKTITITFVNDKAKTKTRL